jgi:hypothetical protein
VSGPPVVIAGVPFAITIEGLLGSAVDPQFSDTFGFSTSDPYAAPYLPGVTTFTPSDGGIKQFAITLISAGPQTITITDLTRGHTRRIVLTIFVDPGDPAGFGVG